MASQNPNPETGEVNLHDPAFTACPHRVLSTLRADFPVARAIGPGGGKAVTVVVSRYEDVIRVLQDAETFSSDIGLGPMSPAPVHVDPPEHARFREALKPRLSRPSLERLEPFIRSEVDRLIDRFAATGACEYQAEFAVPLPGSVMLRILGLPIDDLDGLLALKADILHPPSGSASADAVRRNGMPRAREYFEAVIEERLRHPGDDLLTDLAMTTVEGDLRFTKPEVFRICFNLLLGGLDTLTASLGCAMAYLAREQDQRRRVVESLPSVERAARELMRMESPVTVVPRIARRDVTIAGTEIPAGTLVMALLGAGSADETVFPDADRVDLDRQPNPHLAFGFGRHRCVGEFLGQMVLEVALEGWHRRIPDYGVAPGVTLVYDAVIRSPKELPLVWARPARGVA